MGVYIKGMEMPTSCYDCNCFIRDSDGSDYCCLLMQDIEDNNKRDDDCPLSTVPPHGRLIDADALPWENQGLMLTDPDEWGLKAWDIEHAPTIIPADPAEEGE